MANKITFEEFYKGQSDLLGRGINFEENTPAFYDSIRTWNALAMLFPDRCIDAVRATGPNVGDFLIVSNPFAQNGREPGKITKKATRKATRKTGGKQASNTKPEQASGREDEKVESEKGQKSEAQTERAPLKSESR